MLNPALRVSRSASICVHRLSALGTPLESPHRPLASNFRNSSSFRRQATEQPFRCISSTPHALAKHSSNETERRTPRAARNLHNPDRGPESKEDTQTDFNTLNVLSSSPVPTTSVDVCTFDGFILDSGLRIANGDGVLLIGAEAFVWRPWMPNQAPSVGLVDGSKLRQFGSSVNPGGLSTEPQSSNKTLSGGVINDKGQFEVHQDAWGLFKTLWPRPDILVIGTGASIRPLAPHTRQALQELGMRIEVLDTRNAASQFNLLATERGLQDVGAALLPIGFGER